jgi:hypothetical protein
MLEMAALAGLTLCNNCRGVESPVPHATPLLHVDAHWSHVPRAQVEEGVRCSSRLLQAVTREP